MKKKEIFLFISQAWPRHLRTHERKNKSKLLNRMKPGASGPKKLGESRTWSEPVALREIWAKNQKNTSSHRNRQCLRMEPQPICYKYICIYLIEAEIRAAEPNFDLVYIYTSVWIFHSPQLGIRNIHT